ncbi:zinc-binding dehydrogenase [Nocardia nova]|uniref:zinc-binding dehydrogenase n=1 Tax=Nocardia nova TaxID=37330 RepID=UPI0021584BB1|nr:zinc-binding dehydrogenase [Nocardia nova]
MADDHQVARSARLLGADRVIVIDRYRERLALARKHFDAETIDSTAVDSVQNTIAEMTGGRGPDACIDAVGMGDTAPACRTPTTAPNNFCVSAQQHGQRYVRRIFDCIQQGDLDPSYLITHDLPLEDAVRGYDMFKNKRDGCVRAIFRP